MGRRRCLQREQRVRDYKAKYRATHRDEIRLKDRDRYLAKKMHSKEAPAAGAVDTSTQQSPLQPSSCDSAPSVPSETPPVCSEDPCDSDKRTVASFSPPQHTSLPEAEKKLLNVFDEDSWEVVEADAVVMG